VSAPAHTPVQARERPALLATVARLQRDYPIAQVVALVAVFLYGAATLDNFTSGFSIRAMLVLASLLGISALGQTLCVLIGGMDVSIAGWILVGATTSVELLGGTGTRWAAWQVFLLLGGLALLVGGTVGWICHRYLVPALVLTLATGAIVTGAVLAWKRGFVTGIPPHWLANLSSPGGKTFGVGVPPIVFIWLAVAVVFFVVLHRTVPGAWLYATGNNPRAAKLALVPTGAVWAGVFALSAFFGCMSGVLLAGFAAGGDASIGEPYMWNGITAVLVGGTAFGARGDYLRTCLGTLLLIVLAQVMIGHGADYADQTILYGALILVVVGIYGRDRRLRDQV
jgi:ribose transport system permease protein